MCAVASHITTLRICAYHEPQVGEALCRVRLLPALEELALCLDVLLLECERPNGEAWSWTDGTTASIACPRLRILAIHFSVPDGPEDIEVRTSAVDILHLLRALHGSGDAASLELVLLGHAARNVQCEVEDFGSRIARIIRHPAFQCLHDVD